MVLKFNFGSSALTFIYIYLLIFNIFYLPLSTPIQAMSLCVNVSSLTHSETMLDSQSVTTSFQWSCSEDLEKEFWQQWQQHHNTLYLCCIKWMGGNSLDAEDALSRSMLKAWEKVQKFSGKINNFKAWLIRLTHNLCIDIHRERSRVANRVEDIEGYACDEQVGLLRSEDTPESLIENDEKKAVIRRAIENLPPRLRETFILHFYRELSYQEIAEQQGISYQNVCKRMSQARKILREELRGYFIGEDETDSEEPEVSTATEFAVGEISQENGEVEPIAEETVSLSDTKLHSGGVRSHSTCPRTLVSPHFVLRLSLSVAAHEGVEEAETVVEEAMEDLSYREIARQQEISYQNVDQRRKIPREG